MSITGDAALVAQLATSFQDRFFSTNDRLIRSLTIQMRCNEAEKWLIRYKVMTLLNGPNMPSTLALSGALVVTQREITEWLEDQYGQYWDEIGKETA